MGRQNPSLVIMAEGMSSRFGGLKHADITELLHG